MEHLNEPRANNRYPVALFECGKCGNEFKTTLKTANASASCGCAKFKHKVRTTDIAEILKNNPFIKVGVLAEMFAISYSVAQKHRARAFRLL